MDYEDVKEEVTGGMEGVYYIEPRIRWKRILITLSIIAVGVFLLYNYGYTNWDTGDKDFLRETINEEYGEIIIRGYDKGDYSNTSFLNALEYALENYGIYKLKTELGNNECYLLDISWDRDNDYVDVERLTAYNSSCSSISDVIEKTKIKTKSLVNIRVLNGSRCICGEKIVRIETIGVKYKNVDESSLILEIKSIENA